MDREGRACQCLSGPSAGCRDGLPRTSAIESDRLSRHWHHLVRLDDEGIAEETLNDTALAKEVADWKAKFSIREIRKAIPSITLGPSLVGFNCYPMMRPQGARPTAREWPMTMPRHWLTSATSSLI